MASQPFKPIILSLPGQFAPSIAMEVLPHGVTIHRIYVQADGRTHDIIIGPENPTDYAHATHKYKNTIIGRYTNRIPVGNYLLKHSHNPSAEENLTTIANESPTVSLHGGPEGFDQVTFEVIDDAADLTLFSAAEKEVLKSGKVASFALFRHTSPDNDNGFPGQLILEVLVGLVSLKGNQGSTASKDSAHLGSVFIVYRAQVEKRGNPTATAVTAINITQHWGFNLDASLRATDGPTIKHHTIGIASDAILELGPGFIATGKLTPVKGTPHHHTNESGMLSQRYPEKGYDDYYLFSSNADFKPQPGRVPISSLKDDKFDLLSPIIAPSSVPPPVVLSAPKSGLTATFNTNQAGVQFWSCEPLTGAGAMKRIHGGTGSEDGHKAGYKGGSAAFLEFHEPHAAFLHPEVVAKSITKDNTLLADGELYHNYVKMDLEITTPAETA